MAASHEKDYQTAGFTPPPPPDGLQNWQEHVDLTAENPNYLIDGSVKKVKMGLGWDAGCDVDGSVAVFDQHLQLLDTVWYGQLKSQDGSIKHSGDDATGEGGGDDEVIKVKLAKLHPSVHHIMFIVCVYSDDKTFSEVRSAYARILHGKKEHNGLELAKFSLEHMEGNAMIFGLMSRRNGYWNFRALGVPVSGRTVLDVVQNPEVGQCLSESPSYPTLYREIHLSVKEGQNLAIKDENFFGSGGSSDSFVHVLYRKKEVQSDIIPKNLNPVWDMPPFSLGKICESENEEVSISIWDHDQISDPDFMGWIQIPASALYGAGPGTHDGWISLQTANNDSDFKVKGEILIEITVEDVEPET